MILGRNEEEKVSFTNITFQYHHENLLYNIEVLNTSPLFMDSFLHNFGDIIV